MSEPKKLQLRLWGDTAYWTEAEERRHLKRIARDYKLRPDQIEVERMTREHTATMFFSEKKSKRGGVDGGIAA